MAESSRRITICDGYVDTFAEAFEKRTGVLESDEALGPYEVSASRNRVCVHHAELRNDGEVEKFIAAVRQAHEAAKRLTESDRGNFNWPPQRT